MEPLITPRLELQPESMSRYDEWREMDKARAEGGSHDPGEDAAWLRLLARQGQWSAFGYGFFFICDRTDAAIIGEVGLQRRQRELGPAFDPYPEAAWVVRADRRGQGIAREAMAAVQAWLEATRPELDRVVAVIAAGNDPSRRLAYRLGFRPFAELPYRGEMHLLHERETRGNR